MSEQDIQLDENSQIAIRREKLAELRKQGNAYPNDFRRDALAQKLLEQHGEKSKEELESTAVKVNVAGRIMTRRLMGKASFCHIQDMSGRIQIYLRGEDLPEGRYEEFKHWDIGDIIGIEGHLFKTKVGELSVHATNARLLTKGLRPLPDKWAGLTDTEQRYRQRYVDLIVTEESRRTFILRSKIIDAIRRFMKGEDFLEVETPMMHPIPGGAAARPFVTHHNTLDMQLFLRIAPELYLKRLTVGGFEKVFEINRNFRNEGVSTRHNPEFTMMEFYWAYADYHDLMDFTEQMFRFVANETLGTTAFHSQGVDYDFAKPFDRLSVIDAIVKYNEGVTKEELMTLEGARKVAERLKIHVDKHAGVGKAQITIFEETVEHRLIQPTFICDYPIEVSPLSRRNDEHPEYADRFELFVGGRELANGFSELNDPEDQADRFRAQVQAKEAGDEEAMYFDEDYVNALEYGLPPTAGEGIGIDRFVMLLTDSASIRDVLLFPLMRHKSE
ncbi:lysine--tRNA ligase [Permianibacter aggregans]|uniref:Lysine--tRNA ligase n=1 Tax=Permianibacter aggregans TaxID=1510150 RepID=A0A4R6UXM5_9GAMM|nr:lysine--tRNA ligase [Permianibacter aggregans]QGX41264.1 lysine--tRNA ligase [Permianibacter aggregans]TDQ51046.1 lysyl-tRNA synthetase class II [Permianibacter aggregans]